MPRALNTIAGFFTAGAAGTGVATPSPGVAGSTFTPVTSGNGQPIHLEQVYAAGASTDFVRLRSPRMHDVNNGILLYTGTTQHRPLLPDNPSQLMYENDPIIVEIDETAIATGGILVQYSYDDLKGVNPTLASWNDVQPRIKGIYGQKVTVTSGAIGAWGAAVAINAVNNNFKADQQYALLGYNVSAGCLGIAISGAATGNLPVGGPGDPDPNMTNGYFVDLSNQTGRPCIPVFDSNNMAASTVQNVDVAAATQVVVGLTFAWLG